MAKKDKDKGKGRDCETGRYVRRSTVKKKPKTTVTHKPKKKKDKRKDK